MTQSTQKHPDLKAVEMKVKIQKILKELKQQGFEPKRLDPDLHKCYDLDIGDKVRHAMFLLDTVYRSKYPDLGSRTTKELWFHKTQSVLAISQGILWSFNYINLDECG